jgi:hypothetical protein
VAPQGRFQVRELPEITHATCRAVRPCSAAGPPTVTNEGKTLTYSLMRGRLTEDGEKVFAGFYPGPTDNEFGCVSASFTLP